MKDKISPPQTNHTPGDIVLSTARAAAGAIPFAGAAVAEIVDKTIRSPAERRLSDWQERVTDAINTIVQEQKDITPERLAANDSFLTAVVATTRSAMLTARNEKLDLLQNVVVQTGRGFILDDFIRNTFLDLIDRYTPEHIDLLLRLSEVPILNTAFEDLRRSSPGDISSSTNGKGEYTQLEKLSRFILSEVTMDIADELFRDLHRDGLSEGSEGFSFSYYPDALSSPITARGRAFLKFVGKQIA